MLTDPAKRRSYDAELAAAAAAVQAAAARAESAAQAAASGSGMERAPRYKEDIPAWAFDKDENYFVMQCKCVKHLELEDQKSDAHA